MLYASGVFEGHGYAPLGIFIGDVLITVISGI